MSASHFILLIESETSRTERLAAQLVALGVEPIRVSDLADAVAMIKSKEYAISAVILPADLPGNLVKKALKSMRRREPMLPAMAYGKAPGPAERKALRRCDVLLALWDGYDEGLLRFQLNRLVAGDTASAVRSGRRAPTQTPVRILVGGREKNGILYSVSQGGCFIECPRASMDGARLSLIFELDGRGFEIEGIVVFANVTGNLQRPNLPLGMGVRFQALPQEAVQQLERFIRNRAELIEI